MKGVTFCNRLHVKKSIRIVRFITIVKGRCKHVRKRNDKFTLVPEFIGAGEEPALSQKNAEGLRWM